MIHPAVKMLNATFLIVQPGFRETPGVHALLYITNQVDILVYCDGHGFFPRNDILLREFIMVWPHYTITRLINTKGDVGTIL